MASSTPKIASTGATSRNQAVNFREVDANQPADADGLQIPPRKQTPYRLGRYLEDRSRLVYAQHPGIGGGGNGRGAITK